MCFKVRELERDRDRDRDRFKDRERQRDRDRDRQRDRGEPAKDDKEEVTEKEKDAIRDRYLGQLRKKKRIRRLNERKFVFDWEVTDDTSHDYNPLYNNRHHIQV
jgi:ATP-dependent RNA helicase DDX23/PRP28